jgi:hypothetical protein
MLSSSLKRTLQAPWLSPPSSGQCVTPKNPALSLLDDADAQEALRACHTGTSRVLVGNAIIGASTWNHAIP